MYSPFVNDETRARGRQSRLRRLTQMPVRGGRFGRPTRFLKLSIAGLLLLTGAFLYALLTAFLRWMAIDPFDITFSSFPKTEEIEAVARLDSFAYAADYFKGVLPIPCHSHNDYWRRTPLYAALGTGCVSVEADVWLGGEELYIGHTAFDLTDEGTLRNTYINPLLQILSAINSEHGSSPSSFSSTADPEPRGVFYMDPSQPLTLLIDFKTARRDDAAAAAATTAAILARLDAQLQPLRDRGWLTHWNGTARIQRPLTVVASGGGGGGMLFDLLLATTPNTSAYRDIFFDAPLDALLTTDATTTTTDDTTTTMDGICTSKYNISNSHLASARLADAVQGPGAGDFFGALLRDRGRLSARQLRALRGQIRAARACGLVPRYWGTPRWPRRLRDEVWAMLVREGTGLLSVDDLRAMRKGKWGEGLLGAGDD